MISDASRFSFSKINIDRPMYIVNHHIVSHTCDVGHIKRQAIGLSKRDLADP